MKIKYISLLIAFLVTWEYSTWEPMPCPDILKMNPYSGQSYYSMAGCLVNHGRYVSHDMSKVFETKEEAQKFIDNAPSGAKSFEIKEL